MDSTNPPTTPTERQNAMAARIADHWNVLGLPYERRESGGRVYMVMLDGRDLTESGKAMCIEADGDRNWTTSYPGKELRYDRR